MLKIELLPIDRAIEEFQTQRQFDFFDSFLDSNAQGDILVYRGDINHQDNLSISQLNLENLSSIDGIIIDGNLSVTGTISNYINQVQDRQDCGIEMLVTGSINARSLISTNATIYVCGDLTTQVVYLFYDNGCSLLKVGGTLQTKAFLVDDEHRWDIEKCKIQHDFDLYECDYSKICEVFVDEVIGSEDTKIDFDRLIAALEDGRDIFR
jgi:hypothetical protein